ncbi:MAG: hypothetical protein ACLFOC_06105 [Campylobacterales bacterium]
MKSFLEFLKRYEKELISSFLTIISICIGGFLTLYGTHQTIESQFKLKEQELQFQKEKMIYELNHQNKIKTFTDFSFYNDQLYATISQIQEITRKTADIKMRLDEEIIKNNSENIRQYQYLLLISINNNFEMLKKLEEELEKSQKQLKFNFYNLLPYIPNENKRKEFTEMYKQNNQYYSSSISNLNFIIQDINSFIGIKSFKIDRKEFLQTAHKNFLLNKPVLDSLSKNIISLNSYLEDFIQSYDKIKELLLKELFFKKKGDK